MFDDFQDMDEEMYEGIGQGGAITSSAEPEGLDEARHSTLSLGHQAVEQKLLDLINSGAMPHAIIFSGQGGIGKSTMAFRLARYMLKHGTPDAAQDSLFGDAPAAATSLDVAKDDPTFAKVAAGGHPDFLSIERPLDPKKGTAKKNLDVETARKVAPFLRMTSSNGGWRVVIIDDADSMNRNAQNALLKILEEPPKDALLILVCHRLGAMIPTIRSRCRVMHFDPLDADTFAQLMDREIGNTLSTDEKALLNSLSNGSIGTAKKIIDTKGLETAQSVLNILDSWPNFNKVDIHHLSDQAGRAGNDNAFKNIERLFLQLTEQIIFTKARNRPQLNAPFDKPAYTTMLNDYDLQKWLEIFDTLKAHFDQAQFANLDKRLAIILAFNLLKP
jgi:DNA polymerase-3 subunit delta'